MVRKCAACGAKLSSYNTGKLCFPCQEKRQNELQENLSDGPYYTLNDMCFILGYRNPESVRRLGRNGEIPGRLPGGRHLYQKESIDEWIRNRGKALSDKKEQHFAQLDVVRTALVDNYRKWVGNPVVNFNRIGELIYGGSVYEITPWGGQMCDLMEVDKAIAKKLLIHLKAESTEFANVHDFTDLTNDRHSRKIINLLQAHTTKYQDDCKDCPAS